MKELGKNKEHAGNSSDYSESSKGNQRLLFISHANPEDNAAASWFATQLTLMGYKVWCDLKNTHGGESDFWLKVQQTIENDTAKFIFILSDISRDFAKKKGIYKEVQAADNLRRENFIIPLRIEPLNGSVPIIIGPDLYINSENWAEGLRQLHERLVEDDVPRVHEPDYEKIASWWPALGVEKAIVRKKPQEMVSNIFALQELPENLYLLKVNADGNPITGHEHLSRVMPSHPAHYAHGHYALSFACADNYRELPHGFEIIDDTVLQTTEFIKGGHEAVGVIPQIARNIVTFLVASALEKFLENKGLHKKTVRWSRRKTWYPVNGLLSKNKHSITEPGRRRVPIQLTGTVRFRKQYIWHFGVQPIIDLYTLCGVILSPRVVLTLPYKSHRGERPVPVDEKKALKKLNWWNKEWRQKLTAFSAWLSKGQETIRLPAGSQNIVLSGQPEIFIGKKSYLEENDDVILKEVLGWTNEKHS